MKYISIEKFRRPVGWGCRIRRLHNEATCWSWVEICNTWERVKQSLTWQLSGQVTYNTPLWPLLGMTGGWTGPIQSIGWSRQALAPICLVPTVFFHLDLEQILYPFYLIDARRW